MAAAEDLPAVEEVEIVGKGNSWWIAGVIAVIAAAAVMAAMVIKNRTQK